MSLNHRLDALLKRLIELLARITRARFAKRSARIDRVVLLVAVAMFVVGLVVAYANLPDRTPKPNWGLLVLVAMLGVPLTLATNVAEYVLSGRLLGYRVGLEAALRVSLLASAANLLPLPGSVLVRTQAMRKLGARTGRAIGASTLVGIAWLATSAAWTGGFLLAYGRNWPGVIAAFAGVVLLGTTCYLVVRVDRTRSVSVSSLLVVESASVLVKMARLYLILHALGYQVDVDQAMALTLAAVVSIASGFFPGGLGATEVLSAAVSPLVGLPAAVGLLAAASDRLIGLAVLAVLTGVLLLRRPGVDEDANGVADASISTGRQPEAGG